MSNPKVTSFEVAKRAGVSQSAVSRVFTPGASASKTMTDKVRRAADELGYRPNVLARAMASGKSRMIGLVVAYLDNHFYPEALQKFSNKLQERGYHVLMFMASQTAGNIENIVEEILDFQVDGIIFASVALSSEIVEKCRDAGVPAILFNRSQDLDGVSAVTSDNFEGGRKVARVLADHGHRRIAYIAGWEGASTQRDREHGFRAGLAEMECVLFARGVGNFDTQQASDVALEMFDKPASQRPDAVFVANDHMAFAVIDVLRGRLDLDIPGDVAVVGYDDVPQAAWAGYGLSTVRQRANLMVERTVETLLHQIENPNDFEHQRVAIDGPLVLRNTTKNISI